MEKMIGTLREGGREGGEGGREGGRKEKREGGREGGRERREKTILTLDKSVHREKRLLASSFSALSFNKLRALTN